MVVAPLAPYFVVELFALFCTLRLSFSVGLFTLLALFALRTLEYSLSLSSIYENIYLFLALNAKFFGDFK